MAKRRRWFRLWAEDWQGGRLRTELLEVQGAYIALLTATWTRGGQINLEQAMRLAGTTSEEVAILRALDEYFYEVDGIYRNEKLDKELVAGGGNPPPRRTYPKHVVMFVKRWPKSAPRVSSPFEVEQAWPVGVAHDDVFQGLELWKLCYAWRKDDGAYIETPVAWLRCRRWEAVPPDSDEQMAKRRMKWTCGDDGFPVLKAERRRPI